MKILWYFLILVAGLAHADDHLNLNGDAGLSNKAKAPIPGVPVKKGQFPWRVRLAFGNVNTCSGTIIHPDWVIAPRSCFPTDGGVREVTVYAGGVRYNDHTQTYTAELLPADYIRHPYIVMLKLQRKFVFDTNVNEINLPVRRIVKDVNFDVVVVSGWNSTGTLTQLVSFKTYVYPRMNKCGTVYPPGATTPKPYSEGGPYRPFCATAWEWTNGVNATTIDFMDYYDEYSKKYYLVGIRFGDIRACGSLDKEKCVTYASIDTSSLEWIRGIVGRSQNMI